MSDTKVPYAAGKAAALATYLARGGNIRKREEGRGRVPLNGRFDSGPMKGKTVEQATEAFEQLWAGASGAVKDKYAKRETAESSLSPSEKKAMGKDYKPQTARETAKTQPQQETTVQSNSSKPVTEFNSLTKGPVDSNDFTKPVPEPVGGLNSIGDGQYVNGVKQETALTRMFPSINQDRQANEPRIAAIPSKPVDQSTPLGRQWDQSIRDTKRQFKAVVNAVKSPFVSDVTTAQAAKTSADAQAMQQRFVDAAAASRQAEINKITGGEQNAAPTSTATAPVTPSAAPLPAKPSLPAVGAQPVATGAYAGPMSAPAPAPTGQPIMGDAPKGVNRLTGLPMGFLPGDALPKSANASMQQRATDSMTRQSVASSSAKPMGAMAGTDNTLRSMGIQPTRPPAIQAATTAIKGNDPNIIAKDDAAYKAYQSSFGANTSDADAAKLAGGTKAVYDGATSEDQAKLIANSLKRSASQMKSTPIRR